MSATIASVNDADFAANVLKADLPTLVDFWAPWCLPCKKLAPILEAVAPEYANKVTIVKMDVEQNPDTLAKYGIQSIPTLILFKNGEVEAIKIGGDLNKQKLIAFLDENL